MLLAGIGGYFFWTLKGDDIIQSAIESKVNLLNIPADSVAVSYEEGSLMVYNADLKKYLFENSKSMDVFNSSLISMKGIDWIEVNEIQQLYVDTIEVFIEELRNDLDLLKEMKLAKNKLVKSIHCEKLIVHVEQSEIRNVEALGYLKTGKGIIEFNNVVYSYRDKSLEYAEPSAVFEDLFSEIEDFKLTAKEFKATENEVILVNGELSNTDKSLQSTFGEMILLADFESFKEEKVIESLEVKSKLTKIDQRLIDRHKQFEMSLQVDKAILLSDKLIVNHAGRKKIEFDRISTNVKDFVISNADLSFQNYSFQAEAMQFFDHDEYSMNSGMLKVKKGKVLINDLSINSRKKAIDLSRSSHQSNTIYNLHVSKAEIEGNTIENYLSVEKILMDQLIVAGARLNIYTDNNAQVATKPKKIISQIIKDIDIPVHIPKLKILQSSLVFDLKAKRRTDVGRIKVDNLNGSVTNFSNLPEILKSNNNMKCQFSGLLMGNAPLNMSMDFNMVDVPNSYKYSGNLKGLHFEDVNRMLEDLTAIRVKRGEFDELLFTMKSNKYRTDGTLEFYYKGLKLMHVEERTTGIPDPLRLAVNKLVLRQNNIRGRSPKIATVGLSHPADHSNLRCVWESIYAGLETSFLPKVPKPFKRFRNQR